MNEKMVDIKSQKRQELGELVLSLFENFYQKLAENGLLLSKHCLEIYSSRIDDMLIIEGDGWGNDLKEFRHGFKFMNREDLFIT